VCDAERLHIINQCVLFLHYHEAALSHPTRQTVQWTIT